MDPADSLQPFDFDPRNAHYAYNSRLSWPPPPMAQATSAVVFKRSTSPLPLPINTQSLHQTANHQQSAALMREWQMTSQATSTAYALENTTFPAQPFDPYGVSYQTSPTNYLPPHAGLEAGMEAGLGAGLPMDEPYLGLPNGLQAELPGDIGQLPFSWEDLGPELMEYVPPANALHEMNPAQQPFFAGSPNDGYIGENLEIRSLRSSSSDNGWTTVEHALPHATLFNAEQALHPRSFSDSSTSDVEHTCNRNSWDGFMDIPANAMHSPSTESAGDLDLYYSDHSHYYETDRHSPIAAATTLVKPIAIRQAQAISSQRSSPTSPQKSKAPRKTPVMRTSKAMARRTSQNGKNETEKRVGKRKGPLRPEQRKQAGEIRKLGACLRCRFLKKVCDAGEPCAGCQPSHARLWQVPCTRIDIKDIAYFMKDWKADYERHVSLGFSVGNIKGFSDQERTLFITHGYGHYLPVQAREVYVRDERCFGVDWLESNQYECEVNTAKLSAGMEGISTAMLSNYLDRHIDGGFETFVDDYFEGTPFTTEIFKTAYRYYVREKTPVIRKALKLVLAYNLTQHITLVHGIGSEEDFEGKVEDEASKWNGQIIAPVMINFQVKCAMADMWRELQKDILEELSALYSSVYTRDKLKHWPTIFMLASILLTVWEAMQFDCRFRVPDATVVEKFCNDMETTPVGVIVGLFGAISQKLPSFSEWDTRKHAHLLNSNQAVCDAMEEVREHVTRHDTYLRGRAQANFDREDFDSLSNKFVSKLVIKAN